MRHRLRNGARPPQAHQPDGQNDGNHEHSEGHDPGDAIEAGGGRRGQHGVAVFLHEALQDEGIVVTASQASG